MQAHLAHHEPAYLLEKAKLLFGALQALLEILELRHCLIIGVASKLESDGKLADTVMPLQNRFRPGQAGRDSYGRGRWLLRSAAWRSGSRRSAVREIRRWTAPH